MAKLPRLPDLLTTANLCCGVGSILLASQGQLTLACWLVFAGAFFDVLDGLAARALGGGSELGKQLDSLADMVTFGVAPAFLLWTIGTMPINDLVGFLQMLQPCFDNTTPLNVGGRVTQDGHMMMIAAPALGALILVTCSAWRLAKFNVSTEQTHGFLGLATPANGLLWASLPLIITKAWAPLDPLGDVGCFLVVLPFFGVGTIILPLFLGALMLSNIPLPGLKFKHFKWRGNEVIFLLLGIGAVQVVLYGMLAVPLIMVLYILSPLWGRVFGKGV